MLRLTLSTEEYLMLGDDIKIVFLGGSNNHLRIMVDAPKEVDIGEPAEILRRTGTSGTLSQEKGRGKIIR